MSSNQRILFARMPRGIPEPADFDGDETPIPTPADGQFLARNVYLAIEPYYRNVMKGVALYKGRLQPGGVMYGETVSQVIESRHEDFAAGDYVLGKGGWQQYAIFDGSDLRKLDPAAGPLSAATGVLGVPGLTGYVGMVHLAPPRPGQTVVVSAATGPVGSSAGQVAMAMGARVVGIAGSPEKCEFAVRELGFAECINYKDGDLRQALKRACPNGIDVYFDNVGGDTLAAVMTNLALGAQIVLCGMIGAYNLDTPPPGPSLVPVIIARATVKGLVVFDHLARLPEWVALAGSWVRDGRLKFREDVADGLQQAPAAFIRLMRGENFGKTLVRIAPEHV